MESLIRTDADLVHEIKALDGDMQMLVYENYNKFIGIFFLNRNASSFECFIILILSRGH